ncbi:GPI-anchored surface protein, putative [Bodo saltans]|uniref:GPI-anchored surface protein, putative n=1 Tax=Bodo saltans TaxID=75058 RepID=A0A0S4J8Q1_BODSA|nr:GPI-anchored surface protein, putative [Bodo saltans]|eukprot:CUG87772.1 GPI-anchored surface protein, putative [Bodo saltans]
MSSTSCRVHLLTAVVFTMWLVVGGAHASDAAASTPISCANVPISDCTALPQCYVDSSAGVRTCATFTTCTAFTTDVTCGSASACSWSQLLKSCVLKSICNQIMSSELCSTTYGCVFNSLAGCVGCNQLSSTQCVAGGCRLNGTVCIPSAPPPAPPHPHTVSVSMSFPLQPGDYCFRMTDTLSCLSVPDCYFSAQNKSCIANRFCSQFTNATSTTSASVAAKCTASGCRYLTATTTPSNTLLLPALCISPTALCALQNTSAKCWNTTGCVYLVPLSQGSAAPPGNCMSESFCPFTSLTTCSFFGCTASLTACTNPPRPTTTTTKPFSSDTTTTMIVSTPAPTSTLQPATTTATTPAPTKASDGTQAPTSAATTATPTSTKHSDQTPAPTTSSSPPTRQQTTTAPSTTTTQAPQQQTTASPTSAPSASDYCARLNDSPKACWAMSGCYFWQKGSQTWCSSGTVCTSVIRADECTSLGCVAKTTTALFGSGIIACVPPSPPAPTCATIATKKLCLANTSCTIQDNATCVERCPSGYVVCPSTGACASSLSRCVVCSSSQVQCWEWTLRVSALVPLGCSAAVREVKMNA